MDRLNLPFFYQLGAALKPLTEMKVESSSRFEFLISGFEASMHIRTLLATYPSLAVCKASGGNFIGSMETAATQWRKWNSLPVDLAQIQKSRVLDTIWGQSLEDL